MEPLLVEVADEATDGDGLADPAVARDQREPAWTKRVASFADALDPLLDARTARCPRDAERRTRGALLVARWCVTPIEAVG
ncbi:MAG: hypothetical protein R3F59_17645 [Myxococcota bacterium]